MECIICKDDGSEPLHDNLKCTCKYKYHNSCWIDYVHSRQTVKCLLCSKEYITLSQPTVISMPQQPVHSTTNDDHYQAFQDIHLQLPPPTAPPASSLQPSMPQTQRSVVIEQHRQIMPFSQLTTKQKFDFIAKGLILVTIVIVVIIIIVTVL